MENPRRILIQAMMLRPQVAMNEIRILFPNRFLETIPGVRTKAVPTSFDLNYGQIEEEKIAVIQRIYLKVNDVRQLLNRDYLIIYELDDDPFRGDGYAAENFFSLRCNHAFQTSTQEIAQSVCKFSSEYAVFPNQLVSLPPIRAKRSGSSINIFFGALNRESEYAALLPHLNKLSAEYGERMKFIVIHDKTFFEALQTSHKKFVPACNYQTYTNNLRECDIALLPLTDTQFNRCKSDLKFLECAGNGVVALASPTVYSNTITDGKTGMIFTDGTDFEAKLRLLMDDEVLRFQVIDQAYQYVARERLMAYHYHTRYEWYCSLLDRKEELQRNIRSQAPEVFNGWEPQISHSAKNKNKFS